MMALILSMLFGSCTLVSSLIGARGALMLAELFTARCLGRKTGCNFGASANALRPVPGVGAKCVVANMLCRSAVSKTSSGVSGYELFGARLKVPVADSLY